MKLQCITAPLKNSENVAEDEWEPGNISTFILIYIFLKRFYIFEATKNKNFISIVIGLALFGWFRNGTSSLVNSNQK